MSKEKHNRKEMVLMIDSSVKTILNEDGLATIILPRFKNKLLIKLLVNEKRKNEIKLDLDELGTSVWNLIDGKRTIREILFDLEDVGKNQEQFEERTITFLAGLYRNKILREK
jgi:hypothetical protein